MNKAQELEMELVTELYVTALEKSISFYTTLGFKLLRKETGFAALSWKSQLLYLEEIKDKPISPFPAGNMRLIVADETPYWELALQQGWPVHKALADRPYGLRDFTILDPDGFGVRIGSLL